MAKRQVVIDPRTGEARVVKPKKAAKLRNKLRGAQAAGAGKRERRSAAGGTRMEGYIASKGSVIPELRKAARKAMSEHAGELAVLSRRLEELEASRGILAKASKGPRCPACKKRVGPDHQFCTKCGRSLTGAGVAKSGSAVDERVVNLIRKARSADPAVRDPAVGQLMEAYGPRVVAKVIGGEPVTLRDLGGASPARAAEAPVLTKVQAPALTKAHGARGHGLSASLTAEETLHLAALVSKSRHPDQGVRVTAIGALMKELGAEVTTRIIAGDLVSPEQFTRAYLTNGRANQSAAADQEPRIPPVTHVIRPSDFTRPPLADGHARPAPASKWPGSGGQAGFYGPGPGTATQDSLAGLGNTETGPTAALPARTGW
jgi:hypothetical protein